MPRHDWATIQSWAILILLALLFTHMILQGEWLFASINHRTTTLKALPAKRRIAGIYTVLPLLVVGGHVCPGGAFGHAGDEDTAASRSQTR